MIVYPMRLVSLVIILGCISLVTAEAPPISSSTFHVSPRPSSSPMSPSASPSAPVPSASQGFAINMAVPSWSRIDSAGKSQLQNQYAGYGYSIGDFPGRWWSFKMNTKDYWLEAFEYTVYKTGNQWAAVNDSIAHTDGAQVLAVYQCVLKLDAPLRRDVSIILQTAKPVLTLPPYQVNDTALTGFCSQMAYGSVVI